MSLLLTGATGFVGRNLLLRALARGEVVDAVVRDEGKLRRQLDFESVPASSVRALPAQPERWNDAKPKTAVLSAGVLFAQTREEYFRTNVEWMRALVRALPVDCRVVILSSLSAAGPTPPGVAALTESHEERPITWYGESKLAMERAMRAEFPGRCITILRPPMVLGPRDQATLPLFRMGRGPLRVKPGLGEKKYSFIAVDDLVDAILAALEAPTPLPTCYVANAQTITDRELIAAASEKSGLVLSVPHACLKPVARVIDAIPPLRRAIPSLSGDRVREVWEDRWVADGTKFAELTGVTARRGLRETMDATRDYYRREGLL